MKKKGEGGEEKEGRQDRSREVKLRESLRIEQATL